MGDEGKNNFQMNPYALVALFCACASFGIVGTALSILRSVTDSGMFAIALMTFAPAVMGIGIAYFISKQPKA
jgi:hypothetical protein